MKADRLLLIISIALVITISLLGNSGCANVIPPAGGPRDSLPPVLVKASPDDSTRQFTGNRIVFTFDEYVEVTDAQQQLLVSPIPKTTPSVEYRLKTVTVKLRDSLEPNTTYTLDFGNSIQDYSEHNPFRNFTYTFTTGNYFDSLQFTGNVIEAETGKQADSTLIVMLHTSSQDSAVVNDRPRYIAKVDNKGNFRFKNLPPKTYYLYALKDEGGSRKYLNEEQLFAFADQPVTIAPGVKPVTLYAYERKDETPATPATSSTSSGRGRDRGGERTSVLADRRLRLSTNLNNSEQDLLNTFFLNFDQPLRMFDSTKLTLFTDTTFKPETGYRFVKDTSNKKIELITTWKPATLYHLVLDKDFAEDSTGKRLLKSDTISFRTKKLTDYGELRVKLRNIDLSKNPVLQFVLNGAVTQSSPLTGNEFFRQLFPPGDYDLRILYDDNKNGKWDPGDFFGKHKQPEFVKPVERKIVVKGNGWENEFEIAL
jgi:hypothetical protein